MFFLSKKKQQEYQNKVLLKNYKLFKGLIIIFEKQQYWYKMIIFIMIFV